MSRTPLYVDLQNWGRHNGEFLECSINIDDDEWKACQDLSEHLPRCFLGITEVIKISNDLRVQLGISMWSKNNDAMMVKFVAKVDGQVPKNTCLILHYNVRGHSDTGTMIITPKNAGRSGQSRQYVSSAKPFECENMNSFPSVGIKLCLAKVAMVSDAVTSLPITSAGGTSQGPPRQQSVLERMYEDLNAHMKMKATTDECPGVVKFLFDKGTLYAHRSALTTKCDYFAAMFRNENAESNKGVVDMRSCPDVS